MDSTMASQDPACECELLPRFMSLVNCWLTVLILSLLDMSGVHAKGGPGKGSNCEMTFTISALASSSPL